VITLLHYRDYYIISCNRHQLELACSSRNAAVRSWLTVVANYMRQQSVYDRLHAWKSIPIRVNVHLIHFSCSDIADLLLRSSVNSICVVLVYCISNIAVVGTFSDSKQLFFRHFPGRIVIDTPQIMPFRASRSSTKNMYKKLSYRRNSARRPPQTIE